MAFILFILKCCFFFLFGGIVCYAILDKVFEGNEKLKVLIAVGLGPVLASLFLYYLLLLTPGLPSFYYTGVIAICWFIIACFNKQKVKSFFKQLFTFFKVEKALFSFKKGLYYYLFETNILAFLMLFFMFVFGMNNCIMSGVLGHDALEYMVQGEYFFKQKTILYQAHQFHPESGFYYVGLHGWSFPLQVTLEYLFDDLTFAGYDLYFRMLTPIYGMLILAMVYKVVKDKLNAVWGAAAIALLIFSKGFFISAGYVHIDSYRIFLTCLSIVFALKLLTHVNWKYVSILGFVAGSAAFTHSLSVFISVFIGAVFLFMNKSVTEKIKYMSLYVIMVIASGGIHYLLDVFIGTGWIFGNIDYY